jgi:hypothetical protein
VENLSPGNRSEYVSRTMQAIFDGSRNRCEIAWKIYCMEIAVDMFPENAGNL